MSPSQPSGSPSSPSKSLVVRATRYCLKLPGRLATICGSFVRFLLEYVNTGVLLVTFGMVVLAAFGSYVVWQSDQAADERREVAIRRTQDAREVNHKLCLATKSNRDVIRNILVRSRDLALEDATSFRQVTSIQLQFEKLISEAPPLRCTRSGSPVQP